MNRRGFLCWCAAAVAALVVTPKVVAKPKPEVWKVPAKWVGLDLASSKDTTVVSWWINNTHTYAVTPSELRALRGRKPYKLGGADLPDGKMMPLLK